MKDWIKAGKIASESKKIGLNLIEENKLIKDVQDKIEAYIEEQGAIPAFPAQISINNIAAHYTSTVNDQTTFKKGDIVKLDLGVCVNGAIADTAVSKEIGNPNSKLIEASKAAFEAAIKIVKPGTKVNEIGKIIDQTITSHGFNPIKNLSGHGLGKYEVHSGVSIPNYDNGDETELKENQTIAIEPFATTGEGYVKEGRASTIYKLINTKQIRSPSSRKILNHIIEKYKTLPFCTRQLSKNFSPLQVNLAIKELEKVGNIYQYPQLPERSNGLVSQHENTIIVKNKPIITTL